MKVVAKTGTDQTTQPVTSSTAEQTTATSTDFMKVLRQFIPDGQASEISEEELFASIVRERVGKLKGEEGGKQFDDIVSSTKGECTKGDGFVAYEDLTKKALQKAVQSGLLTLEESDDIYSQSFSAAQLDDNTTTLWDSRGGANDPTRAVQSMEAALSAANLKIQGIESGTLTPEALSLSGTGSSGSSAAGTITPQGTTVDGPDGFLFKPVSVNQGTVAVLLPQDMKFSVEKVVIKDSLDNILDEGRSTGYGDTGEREKFSFSKPGVRYPKDIYVEVTKLDGTSVRYAIPDPSQRYD